MSSILARLLGATALTTTLLIVPAIAETPAPLPFAISIDGNPIAAGGSPTRQELDIQIKFDGLDVAPTLNVMTADGHRRYAPGAPVRFLSHANYPAFIARAEVLLRDADHGDQPLAVLPVAINDATDWEMPATGAGRYSYTLRVYDAQGRFDETAPLLIERGAAGSSGTRPLDLQIDRSAVRNIAVYGGAVTVFGRQIPRGDTVKVLGEAVPLESDAGFVFQRILPPGDQMVDVAVGKDGADQLQFSRAINIPDSDWFYVALADLTLGYRSGSPGIEAIRPDEYDRVYSRGRVAFYVKGKIKGQAILTAAADTGEAGLEALFGNLGGRNARYLLTQLDPDAYYPVYGDDSALVEDAPTSGKFYVRLERGDSQIMWGNYKTAITGTQFLRSERSLYGANGVYRSAETTTAGERQTALTAYAALPETLAQRDEFLATGGSAYFLRRQGVAPGSETIAVERRDATTGRLIERRTLRPGTDYRLDALQGTLILTQPLSGWTGTTAPVREDAIGGQKIYLVAQYEYEPIATDLDGYLTGGRAEHWFGDHLRVGVTGSDDRVDGAAHSTLGADVIVRQSDTTYLRAEIARSTGQGSAGWHSSDGGLTWATPAPAGAGRDAWAYLVEGKLDLSDLDGNPLKRTLGVNYQHRDAGFSSLNENVLVDQTSWGLDANIAFDETLRLVAAYDDFSDGDGQLKRKADIGLETGLDDFWTAAVGLTYSDLYAPRAIAAGKSGYDGQRVDAGVRVAYAFDEKTKIYGFGQGTLGRSGDIGRNDRLGMGATAQLTDSLALEGEISYGTGGFGALAGLTLSPNADEQYYLGYRRAPDRMVGLDGTFDLLGEDRGTIVTGLKRRLNEVASTYTETSYDMFGERRSLTQTYGVSLTPDARWNIGAGLVVGNVRDDTTDPETGLQRADFDRYAPSLAVSYVDEAQGIKAHGRGEVRIEDSADHTRDQQAYLLGAGLSWKASEDWRMIANLDAIHAHATPLTGFADTTYLEATLGYAYRPVDNDRLNALFSYTYLFDLPGNDPLAPGAIGGLLAPAQNSHILSADFTYDLLPWLSVGGKYGMRIGEVQQRDAHDALSGDWRRSSAHLGILRADLQLLEDWDVLVEARALHMPEAGTTDYGALGAIYYSLGDNLKLGGGYNFGRFSDDLRDLSLDDRGAFINLVAKF
jgi:hypothetical protein